MSSVKLDYFLDNPELKIKHEEALPTYEMYRFFPPEEEIILTDSNPKNNYRFIFNGQPKTDFEKKKLANLQEYESSHGKLNYPQDWIETDTMRVLQASEYDMKKTYKTLEENIKFINNIPKFINDKIISLLNSGFLYVFGRDHHFRPIIVCSIKTCTNLFSKNIYSLEDISQSIIYLVTYILKYLLIPGQIENWVIFVDFKDVGLSDIAEFKQILGTLSKFRGRVFRNYIVNIGGFLKIAVKAALKVFGSSSSKKLRILGSDELHKIQEIISPDNIQKQYGGLAPDIIPGGNNLFPPIMPSKNFSLNGEKLNIISEEDYREMCINSNPYKPFTIYPKFELLNNQKDKEREEDETTIHSKILSEKKNNVLKEKIKEEIKNKEKPKNNIINQLSRNILIKNSKNKNKMLLYSKEFERFNNIDINEERKYSSKTPINIKELKIFFNKIKNYKKFSTLK